MIAKSGLRKLILAVAFGCVSLPVSSTWAIAQPARPSATERPNLTPPESKSRPRRQPIRLILPQLPKGISSPGGRRYGGARRTGCPKDVELQLTALVPATESQPTITNVWGLTSVERPILWFYTPYNKSSKYPADFELLDDQSTPIYKTAISLPNVAGVIGVPLPPLAVGKQYRWFLNVYCDREGQETPIFVEGVVQRVNLSQAIQEQLRKAEPIQQIAIYANNGIWHEALTTLAQLRQKNPNDATLAENWKELLTSVGLTQFVTQPLTVASEQ
ncbi:DUF928 domain-containing protein [Scytonema sp. UIC 10036]|uniref:DUF928 domain-containing protein n=1 Tax=Scytonema sp. UIC 10036 TaxID=2304196 RepID=UPI0012DA2842|nr:DUF928 domain-containing protein [Scytonema sp. UIC 10036]MUG96773.1 DUF928 domain-containing protein [Scytonema sp. UIC 10036]